MTAAWGMGLATGGAVVVAGWVVGRRPTRWWTVGPRAQALSWVRRWGVARIERWGSGRTTLAEVEPLDLLRMQSVLHGGGSALQALQRVADGGGPWADDAALALRRVASGYGLQASLDRWAHRSADPAVALLADALALAARSGASQARALDAALGAVRDRRSLQREVRALSSQARASAAVLVVLPVGFAIVLAAVDGRIRTFFVGGAMGPVVVAAGIALDVAGARWMAHLGGRVS